ncbi:acyl-CoA dehydrogenase family protein [Nocardia sp. alder85J]|uniref:acyl-CoA dehydrogenase family protein n=1 Tax=Nocardia sp. alder85J TaxID=2862949 RepID=UPI001CD55CE3|nr:acyl-CoA dehydrogenase family protein [Nocardia sp. alder85J]MCX4097738.1 acyl-CoA dehydrogenase family protein [Nocardia sp. alder85J]
MTALRDTHTSTITALRTALSGPDPDALRRQVRDVVTGFNDTHRLTDSPADRAALGRALLPQVLARLPLPGRELASSPRWLAALYRETAVHLPTVMPLLSGQLPLVQQAIRTLGGPDHDSYLEALDTGALGVLLVTETAGTNGNNCRTVADYDPATDRLLLTTPDVAAEKFGGNVADHGPQIVAVSARLRIGGRDEGLFLFLLTLRTAAGLADGVRVTPLGPKAGSGMHHARISFDHCPLPREAMLGGDWARLTPDGELLCDVPVPDRFRRSVAVLDDGRLHLSLAASAAAGAALVGLGNWAPQRRPGTTRMSDRPCVQQQLVTALAAVYATSALSQRLLDMRADGHPDWSGLWPMIAKPITVDTATRTLTTVRYRTGIHGTLLTNLIASWLLNADCSVTAEGDNEILTITGGYRLTHRGAPLTLPGTPTGLPPYITTLTDREHALREAVRTGEYRGAGPVLGGDGAAMALAVTTGQRLAATALLIAADTTGDDHARDLLTTLAAAYAHRCLYEDAAWYTSRGHQSADQVTTIEDTLVDLHQQLLDHLPPLLAAFDVGEITGAPIFADDYLAAIADGAADDHTARYGDPDDCPWP